MIMIPLRTLNIYRDKVDQFINKGYCHARIWPVFDAWVEGDMAVSYGCVTDGLTIYAEGYSGKPQIKIGDTINKKKYIYDYTHHFYKGIDLNISFKIGGLKKRISQLIRSSDDLKGERFNCILKKVDDWGYERCTPNIDVCRSRHKKEYCSGFKVGIHGRWFCKSDFTSGRAGDIPYYEIINKVFSIMDKYPQIVRPQ